MKQLRSAKIYLLLTLAAVLLLGGCQPPEQQIPSLEFSPVIATVQPESAVLPETDEFAILLVNVGRADAAIIRFGETCVLIDTGTEDSVPQLIAGLNLLNITRIDAVFLTHSHADHIGGLNALAANYDIPMVYSPLFSEQNKDGIGKIVKLCDKLELNHTELTAGQTVPVTDSVSFEVLGPLAYNEDDDNDNSLILRFSYEATSFLFVGDAQFNEEQALLGSSANLDSDVLKVGNHGNPDATGEDFTRAVSPAFAVISTDTSVDRDSANERVLAALAPASVAITQDYPLGVLLTLNESGKPVITNPSRPAFTSPAAISSIDADSQTVTISNPDGETIDLSGCVLVCDRSGAALRFPEGTLLAAGTLLTVSGSESGGTFVFAGEDKPLSAKKQNTVTLYSPYGEALSMRRD
jgi:competence protein ComEC